MMLDAEEEDVAEPALKSLTNLGQSARNYCHRSPFGRRACHQRTQRNGSQPAVPSWDVLRTKNCHILCLCQKMEVHVSRVKDKS